jgi:hypothetical protein
VTIESIRAEHYDVERGVAHVHGDGCQCDRRGTMDVYECKGCSRLWGYCVGNDATELCDECDVAGASPRSERR